MELVVVFDGFGLAQIYAVGVGFSSTVAGVAWKRLRSTGIGFGANRSTPKVSVSERTLPMSPARSSGGRTPPASRPRLPVRAVAMTSSGVVASRHRRGDDGVGQTQCGER